MITIKNASQIELMRHAGKIVARTHELLQKSIKPNINTKVLDKLAYDFIISQDAVPSFLNYRGYPATINVSINDEVIHGIPNKNRLLKDGDVVSIDIGASYKGYHADAARTYGLGIISDDDKKLIEVTKGSFFKALEFAKDGMYLNQICAAIESYVTQHDMNVVRDFVGHGIGKELHESPNIPNYKMPKRGPRLSAGMTLAIEPMVNIGSSDIKILADDWTVVTLDGKKSAHYENTILITDGEPEILTIL